MKLQNRLKYLFVKEYSNPKKSGLKCRFFLIKIFETNFLLSFIQCSNLIAVPDKGRGHFVKALSSVFLFCNYFSKKEK